MCEFEDEEQGWSGDDLTVNLTHNQMKQIILQNLNRISKSLRIHWQWKREALHWSRVVFDLQEQLLILDVF